MDNTKHSETTGPRSAEPVTTTIPDAISDELNNIRRLAEGTDVHAVVKHFCDDMEAALEPDKEEDIASALYRLSSRCLDLYGVAELFAQHHEAAEEPGAAFSLIAAEAQRLNDELFELAGKVKGDPLARLGVVPEDPDDAPLGPTTNADFARFQVECANLSAEECAKRLRGYLWDVSENIAAHETEDDFTVTRTSTLKGLRLHLAREMHLESLLPPEEEPVRGAA